MKQKEDKDEVDNRQKDNICDNVSKENEDDSEDDDADRGS